MNTCAAPSETPDNCNGNITLKLPTQMTPA